MGFNSCTVIRIQYVGNTFEPEFDAVIIEVGIVSKGRTIVERQVGLGVWPVPWPYSAYLPGAWVSAKTKKNFLGSFYTQWMVLETKVHMSQPPNEKRKTTLYKNWCTSMLRNLHQV